jgi:tetratricopeptide (TPR) repeat protein
VNTSSHRPAIGALAFALAMSSCATVGAGERREDAHEVLAKRDRDAGERAEHARSDGQDEREARGQRTEPYELDRGGEAPYELDPLVIEVDPDTGEVVAYDPRSLLDAGNEAFQAGRPARAIAYYEQLAEEFPQSSLVVPALYNRGLALERLGAHDAAVAQYLELAERIGEGRDAIDATIRAGAVLAELGRWPDAIESFERLLERGDLSATDRVEGHARLGYVLYENKRDPRAEAVLREGLEIVDNLGGGEHLETNAYVAMIHFYLGMIPRRQFSEIPLRLPDEQMEQDLEDKSELVLLAHERLSRAIHAGDPRWATAAGFELGAMQEEFWQAIVSAPIPPHLGPRAVEAYTEEVHVQARVFLERALNLYRKTVELAEAYRTSTRYSRAAEARAEAVVEILARERAGELVTPEARDRTRVASEPAEGDWDVATYVPSRTNL